MKSKILAIIAVVMLCLVSLVGCSETTAVYSVNVTHDGNEVLSAAENVEKLLQAVQIAGQPLFKEVEIEENKGIFYTSYKFTAKSNAIEQTEDESKEITIRLTVPGNVTQMKNGEAEDSTVTFALDLTQENDIAVFSDANNYAIVIGIVLVLIVTAVILFFLTRNRE